MNWLSCPGPGAKPAESAALFKSSHAYRSMDHRQTFCCTVVCFTRRRRRHSHRDHLFTEIAVPVPVLRTGPADPARRAAPEKGPDRMKQAGPGLQVDTSRQPPVGSRQQRYGSPGAGSSPDGGRKCKKGVARPERGHRAFPLAPRFRAPRARATRRVPARGTGRSPWWRAATAARPTPVAGASA